MYSIWYENGLVALPTCPVNPGENVLLPDPGYTDYLAGVMLADAQPVPLNLEPPHYLPDWDKIDKNILNNTKLIYLTYPNNPTGSTAKQCLMKQFKDLKIPILKLFMILLIVHSVLMLKIQAFYLVKMARCSS